METKFEKLRQRFLRNIVLYIYAKFRQNQDMFDGQNDIFIIGVVKGGLHPYYIFRISTVRKWGFIHIIYL